MVGKILKIIILRSLIQKTEKELKKLIKNPKYQNFIGRGNSRSYGDSSLNKNIISLKNLKKNLSWSHEESH